MTNTLSIRESLGTAIAQTGLKRRAKLIAADVWGSTAYYPADVLERDGARVFTAGIQMFENHLTESQEWERPEGDVDKLIGKLTSDAIYEAAGEDGPGLYADVEFYESYGPRINEIGNDIGLSVRASGLTEDGEMDGRYGPILIGLLSAKSVDVVTRAGAGGKLTSILESDRELAGRPLTQEGTQSVTDVTKEDFEALKLALTESIASLSSTLTEALKPAVITTVDPELEPKDEVVTDAITIDHAAVVEAFRTNELPAASAGAVIAALTEGKTLDEAIKVQTDLREAFQSTAVETGTVVIKESDKATGLARSVTVLG